MTVQSNEKLKERVRSGELSGELALVLIRNGTIKTSAKTEGWIRRRLKRKGKANVRDRTD